jgi:DNA-directed RNA polymerase specialized sigma24 family protein
MTTAAGPGRHAALGVLVRAAQGGDTMAMHDLLDQLSPYVGRICGPIALQQAADAAQETLIAVFRNLGHLRNPAALPDLPSPDDTELAADVRDVLARLSPEHRAVLVLRDLEGLDEQEAAALLSLPAGTVKSPLHRARGSF